MNRVRKPSRKWVRSLSLLLILSLLFAMPACSFGPKETADDPGDSQTAEDGAKPDDASPDGSGVSSGGDLSGRSDLAYVMIYNPGLYNEQKDHNEKLSTGAFGTWIDTSAVRASVPRDDASEYGYVSQKDLSAEVRGMDFDLSGSRASVPQPSFKQGDTREFYYTMGRTVETGSFSCVNVGEKCCVWFEDGVQAADGMVEAIVKEFDGKIYDADVETFGTPRYADVNGKIHILFHPMESEYLCGYFRPADLFSHEEATDEEAKQYGLNRDLAIIHLNSFLLQFPAAEEFICSTLAHELQHLINFTDFVEYNGVDFSATWINESMSGYIEEKLYPGVKESGGDFEAFATSDLIRHGQSMYNFDNTDDDIGVYGSVFLMSQYLENLAGDRVFKDYHDYWRRTFDPASLTDAKALYATLPSDKVNEIDRKYNFSDSIHFSGEEERWLSKMTLDFYISLLKYDSADPDAYQLVQAQTLLYDEVNPADIEGGGRVIAATKDGRFEIPTDSDHPLVYIGFDADFNQITDVVIR